MATLSFDEARSVVGEAIWYEAWRADFDRSADAFDRPGWDVPEANALARRCAELGFPERSAERLVEHRPSWDDPRIRRLGAHVQWNVWERYRPGGLLALGWPPAPAPCPLFYAYAAIGLAAATCASHRELGVSPDVSRATFWDVGQQVLVHEALHGTPGMGKGWWLAHHLTSHLFRLGRLQFQRSWLGGGDLGPLRSGDAVLDVHIPEDGAFPPEACDDSFDAAVRFFARHFPEHRPRAFTCHSWLLDPQLPEILPEDSNIVRFQRRFRLVARDPGASSVFEFVFHRPDLDRAERPDCAGLPRDTRVQRALLDHHAAGGRIGSGSGIIEMGDLA